MSVPGLRGSVLLSALLVGCVHFNAVYNADRQYEALDRDRRLGINGSAHEAYGAVIERARRGFEADPDGDWADDALLLMGRAHLRRGEYAAARERLRQALGRAESPVARATARMYLGAIEVLWGRPTEALSLLTGIEEIQTRLLRGEGHLWRARALLALGRPREAWAELEAAEDVHPDFRPGAELLRLGWGLEFGDAVAAFAGLQALMAEPDARFFGDSVRALLESASRTSWEPSVLVSMLDGAGEASWSRQQRDRLLLLRARLARRAGRDPLAFAEARRVSGGAGPVADEARVQLAHWRLAVVEQLSELGEIRGALLPAVADARARALANDIRRVQHLVDAGLAGEGAAFFAAAERTRESLGAPILAASLFLAFVDLQPESPWAGKALLAARELVVDPARREAIELRLRGLPDSEYVRYARTGEATGALATLEERLQSAMTDLLGRVETELRERRLLVEAPPGTRPAPEDRP